MLRYVRTSGADAQENASEDSFSLDQVLTHYLDSSKPAFEHYIAPSRRYADVILPPAGWEGVDVEIRTGGVELIAEGICDEMRDLMSQAVASDAQGGMSEDHSLGLGEHGLRKNSMTAGSKRVTLLSRGERSGLYYETV